MELTSHGFLNGFHKQPQPELPDGEGRPRHVELHGIESFWSCRGPSWVTFLSKGLVFFCKLFSLNNISASTSHRLNVKKELYWEVREEMLFIIRLPYKMERGSDLGGHDSDTVSLAIEGSNACPPLCLRLIVKMKWNN